MLKVLSLGAGVQSTAVLLMSARGVFEKLDAAVFADTQWEPREVYKHLDWLEKEAGRYGIPVHRVTAGNIREDAIKSTVRGLKGEGKRWVSIPFYTKTDGAGQGGQLRRQCTSEYKIRPVDKFIRRKLLGLKKGERATPGLVELWFGISADEMRRVRQSRDRWKINHYPLIGLPGPILERPYTRARCKDWLEQEYPERQIPRSACLGCPYHSRAEWKMLQMGDQDEWLDIVEFDRKTRHCGGENDEMFIHNSRLPIENVDFQSGDDTSRQENLFENECEGMCGV